MRRLRKFIKLTARRKLLLFDAILALGAVRVALSLVAFGTLRRLLSHLAHFGDTKAIPPKSEIDDILWALGAAGRAFPAIGTCLSQALVGHAWLGSKGYRTDLRIGANHDSGKFSAHAWLQRGDTVVMGYIGREHDRFTPFRGMRGLEPL
jgi:transglutaminase superfamily protein